MVDSCLIALSKFTHLDATADNLITHVSRFLENSDLSSLANLSNDMASNLGYASQFPLSHRMQVINLLSMLSDHPR